MKWGVKNNVALGPTLVSLQFSPTHMSNIIKQNNTAEILGLSTKSERNRESKIWADGSKYGFTFLIEGVTDQGKSYAADVDILIQIWTDINDRGGFVFTADARIERFTKVAAYGATKFGSDYTAERAHLETLTEAERDAFYDADEAAQEKADAEVDAYLARVCYEPQFKALADSLKQSAIKIHLSIR